eukprot:scpid44778/ scgid34742/ Abl interactor 1; Abelson interactor 1; Abl-binding protein 4; Eps8 SH3 domain-binding protein; Nap1-binding protein; Spectrin SH3 domain-binding protein 1; e3B1
MERSLLESGESKVEKLTEEQQGRLNDLLANNIPESRQQLLEGINNLRDVAEYCEQAYQDAGTELERVAAIDTTKAYCVQSLASVAYQVDSLATQAMDLFTLQTVKVDHLEMHVNNLHMAIDIHKEKVARRQVGLMTRQKQFVPEHCVLLPPILNIPLYKRRMVTADDFARIGNGRVDLPKDKPYADVVFPDIVYQDERGKCDADSKNAVKSVDVASLSGSTTSRSSLRMFQKGLKKLKHGDSIKSAAADATARAAAGGLDTKPTISAPIPLAASTSTSQERACVYVGQFDDDPLPPPPAAPANNGTPPRKPQQPTGKPLQPPPSQPPPPPPSQSPARGLKELSPPSYSPPSPSPSCDTTGSVSSTTSKAKQVLLERFLLLTDSPQPTRQADTDDPVLDDVAPHDPSALEAFSQYRQRASALPRSSTIERPKRLHKQESLPVDPATSTRLLRSDTVSCVPDADAADLVAKRPSRLPPPPPRESATDDVFGTNDRYTIHGEATVSELSMLEPAPSYPPPPPLDMCTQSLPTATPAAQSTPSPSLPSSPLSRDEYTTTHSPLPQQVGDGDYTRLERPKTSPPPAPTGGRTAPHPKPPRRNVGNQVPMRPPPVPPGQSMGVVSGVSSRDTLPGSCANTKRASLGAVFTYSGTSVSQADSPVSSLASGASSTAQQPEPTAVVVDGDEGDASAYSSLQHCSMVSTNAPSDYEEFKPMPRRRSSAISVVNHLGGGVGARRVSKASAGSAPIRSQSPSASPLESPASSRSPPPLPILTPDASIMSATGT